MVALLAVFGWQAGAVLALGLTCFVSRAGPVPPVLARWREHLRILMMASIAMGVLAGVSVLLAQSLRLTGAWQPWSSSTWTALLLHTRFGQGWSLSKLFWLPCCWWCYSPAAPAGLSLVLSGVIIASTQLIYWRALFGTRYGGVLGLKLALIAFALAAAFACARWCCRDCGRLMRVTRCSGRGR